MPFLAPWLADRGFAPASIGWILAIPPFFKLTAAWTWGAWADRSHRRRELLALAGATAALALATAVLGRSPLWIVAFLTLYGFSRAPMLPFIEATALEYTERRGVSYGPLRLWGSASFMVASVGCGLLQIRGGSSGDLALWSAAGMLAACAAVAPALPAPVPPPADSAARGPFRPDVPLLSLLGACWLMQLSHGAYYSFYSIRLGELGFDRAGIGIMWAFGVLCEIAILTRMDDILARWGRLAVLRAALVTAVARWLLIATTESSVALAFAQTMHAATYAAFHVAAIREVFRRFGPRLRARGQAVYSGTTFGLGTLIGSPLAGWVAERYGLPAAFRVSAVFALLALPLLGRKNGSD